MAYKNRLLLTMAAAMLAAGFCGSRQFQRSG